MADRRADQEKGAVLIAVNSYWNDPERRLLYSDRVLKGYIETFYRYLFFRVDVVVDFTRTDFIGKLKEFTTWCRKNEMNRIAVVLYGHGGIDGGKEYIFTNDFNPLGIAALEEELHSQLPDDNKYLFIDACRNSVSVQPQPYVFQAKTSRTTVIRSTLLFKMALSNAWSECFAMNLRKQGALTIIVNNVDDNMKEKYTDDIRRKCDIPVDEGDQKSDIRSKGASDDPSFRGEARASNQERIRELTPSLQRYINAAEGTFTTLRAKLGLPPEPILSFLGSPADDRSNLTGPGLALSSAQGNDTSSADVSQHIYYPVIDDLKISFSNLAGNVLSIIGSLSFENLETFCYFLLNYLKPSFPHDAPLPVIPKTVQDLQPFLIHRWDPLQIALLKAVVQHLASSRIQAESNVQQVKAELNAYEDLLKGKLPEFLSKCKSESVSLKPLLGHTSVTVKIASKPEEISLARIIELKGFFINKLGLPDTLFTGFSEGCTVLFFSIPTECVWSLPSCLHPSNLSLLEKWRVLFFSVKGAFTVDIKESRGVHSLDKLIRPILNPPPMDTQPSSTTSQTMAGTTATSTTDLQRPGDSVSQHSLPSTGQPNQGGTVHQQTMPPSTTPVEDQRTLALSKAHEKLKRFYTKPAKCKPFVNLALVERPSEVDKTKKDVKEFLEATEHGIDRYTGEQKKIEYETILTSTGSDSGKRVLINGSPGCGKTTLARKLCRDLYSGHLPNQYQLVLFAELKYLRLYTNKKSKKANLLTLLEYLELPKTDSLYSLIKEKEGRGVAIILDGFDEISDDSCVTEWVSEVFCDKCLSVSECDVFVTTRPSQLSKLAEVASVHLEILGFSSSNIECYIKDYFKGAPDKAEEVIRKLTGLPLVRGLCSNPRVLEIACKVLKHQDEELLPANLSGIFLRYICYQLEVDLKDQLEDDREQRHPHAGSRIEIETRIKESDLLNISEKHFRGFYPLCSLAYHCCLNQKLVLEIKDLKDMKILKYINNRGSVYNLMFGEEVDSSSEILCVLYQCDHKTVMEALAAVHIAVLSPAEQQQIWEKWFTTPHMAQVWMMYCGLTGLKFVDLRRLCSLTVRSERSREVAKDLVPITSSQYDAALDNEGKLVMVSLFEAGNDDVAKRDLPVLLKDTIRGTIRSRYDVQCLAYSITHHPHLSRVGLNLFTARVDHLSEPDLQPLTTSLKNVKAVEIKCDNIQVFYIVLPRAVEELSLDLDKNYYNYDWLHDALTDCHCLRSLTITHPDFGVWTGLDSVLNSTKPTEFHLKGGEYFGGIPSDESLKTLLVHREKCSLQILKLNDYHISVVLSGLKKADQLEELDLHIGVLISGWHESYKMFGTVTCAEVEDLVATHPHLVKVNVTCAEVEDLVATHPHLVKVNVITYDKKSDLLIAVVKGAIRNKNITHLGLGPHEINAVHPLLCSPSAEHITSIRVEHLRHDDAWSEDVIAGSMARQTCHLDVSSFTPASFGLLLSRVNTATKLKDLSLEVDASQRNREDYNLVDVRAVETAFTNCSLHKLRIKFKGVSDHSMCHLQTAILNGLAANTTIQVDSCIYCELFDTKEITRHLSQQAQQRFEVVRTGGWSFFISRDPPCPSAPVPAPNPRDLLSTPPQSTSPMPVTTPPDPPPTPPGVGELLRKYKDRIYSEVKSTVVSPRLQMEEVISREVAREIKDKGDKKGNCLIYLHLMERDLKSLQTFGTVLAEEEENVKMQRLGEDLLADITLPHGCP